MTEEEDDGTFRVDFSTGVTVDVNELRKRGALSADGGVHLWVIQAVYHLEDPEVAMDQMVLGSENFVGVSDIHCFCCGVSHRTASGPRCKPGDKHPEEWADAAVTTHQ